MRERAERSLRAILAAGERAPLEVIVVDTEPTLPPIDGTTSANVVREECPDAPSFAHAKLAGLKRCSATRVAFVEDHAFVAPGWAQGVLRGFDTGAEVVVYTFRDATPETLISRSFVLLAYGRWMSEKFAGDREHGPGNNVAYLVETLLRQGDRLEDLMHVEYFLHRLIREQGGRVHQEPTACSAHANWDTVHGTLMDTCMSSRLFAHQRVILEKPSWRRRVFLATLMPLLPGLLFWRYARILRRDSDILRQFLRRAPVILFLIFCTGISEAIGYLSSTPRYRTQLDTEVNMRRACDPRERPGP
jgi:hypothetical protein